MRDAHPFDPDRWEMPADREQVPAPAVKKKRPSRPRRSDRFLKGPVPWPWLVRAMALPGKSLAIGLILWLQCGIARRQTVLFCLARAVDDGIPTSTARRAVRALEQAGLVAIRRRPGRGLEVTVLDPPAAPAG
jgi:hypothetical protein